MIFAIAYVSFRFVLFLMKIRCKLSYLFSSKKVKERTKRKKEQPYYRLDHGLSWLDLVIGT